MKESVKKIKYFIILTCKMVLSFINVIVVVVVVLGCIMPDDNDNDNGVWCGTH